MRSIGYFGGFVVRLALLLWVVLGLASASYGKPHDSEEGRRLALVIGNSSYSSLPALRNAAGDAKLVGEALSAVGFKVKLVTNATLDEMQAAVEEMANGAQPTDHVVFYYSGHGFQLDGINYIVPIDAVLTSKEQIDTRTIRLNEAITKLQGGGRQTMVFIDACRDNPLPPAIRGNQTVNGLAKLGDGVAQNLYVAFATSPGKVSLDGTGAHGPFAQALARYLPQPDVPIYLMMTSVRNDVSADTNGDQVPAVEESLLEPFYFNGERGPVLTFGPMIVASGDPGVTIDDPGPKPMPPTGPTGQTQPPIDVANLPTAPATGVPGNPGQATAGSPEAGGGASLPTGPVDSGGDSGGGASLPGPQPGAGGVPPTSDAQVAVLGPGTVPTAPQAPDYALQVQTELARLGCFDGKLDGEWDAASKKALLTYDKVKKVASLDADPSADLYTTLKAEPTGLCDRKPAPPSTGGRQTAGTVATTPPTQRQRTAPPPVTPVPPAETVKPGFNGFNGGSGGFR